MDIQKKNEPCGSKLALAEKLNIFKNEPCGSNLALAENKIFSSMFLIFRDHTKAQGKEHTHEKNPSFLFLICQDHTESQGKEHTQK